MIKRLDRSGLIVLFFSEFSYIDMENTMNRNGEDNNGDY